MDTARLLAEFDAEVRAQPFARPGLTVERADGVVRLTGDFNFVSWWQFSAVQAADAVARQAADFRARAQALIWRVYDHDEPKNLSAALLEADFRPHAPGTLMAFDLASEFKAAEAEGVRAWRVRSPTDLDLYVAAANAAFGDTYATRNRQAYADGLDGDAVALFVATKGGAAVGAARLESGPQGRFGLLFGGGVARNYRKRGVYRALVAARVAEARRLGLGYLATEARDESRTVLARLGFIPIVSETTWVLPGPIF